MKLDTNTPFGAIHGSSDQLKAEMLEVSQFANSHHRDHNFPNTLHFLAPYQPGATTTPAEKESPTSRDQCPCKSAPKFSHSRPQTLRLAEIHECSHYLAVSYCWHRGETPTGPVAEKFLIRTAQGEDRHARAPTAVLKRAIEYAIQHSISYIWIDQDCIEQNYHECKIAGIQSLDLVYRRAEYSVGLLKEPLTSQRNIDALLAMRRAQHSVDLSNEGLLDLDWDAIIEVLELLACDEWFTRSWILQEYALAQNMRLLVNYTPSLKLSTIAKIGQDQAELHPKDFELGDIGRQYVTRGKLAMPSLDRLQQAIDSITARPACQPLGISRGEDERFGTNAASALWYLRKRKNTRVRDRITIIGNLCDYPTRFDTRQEDLESHSFSITILTLALLNGDFSVLFSEPDHTGVAKLSDSWLPSPFTALDKLRGVGDRRGIVRFATSGIFGRGLDCKGYITQVNTQIDMTKVQRSYSTEYQRLGIGGKRRNSETQQELDIVILSEVTRSFERQGYHNFAALMRNSMDRIDGSDSHIPTRVVHSRSDDHLGAGKLGWLVDAVMSRGCLWCGIIGEASSTGKPTAIFNCSGAELVFTPYSESFKSLPRSTLLDLPVSWVIDNSHLSTTSFSDSRVGLHAEDKVLIKCVRHVDGIHQGSLSNPESCTLAWPPA